MKFCEKGKTEVVGSLCFLPGKQTTPAGQLCACAEMEVRRADNLPRQHKVILWTDSQQSHLIVKTVKKEFFS